MPEEFNLKYNEVLADSEEQFCFKRGHFGKILGLVYIHRLTPKLADEDQKINAILHILHILLICHSMEGCSGPIDLQNKT